MRSPLGRRGLGTGARSRRWFARRGRGAGAGRRSRRTAPRRRRRRAGSDPRVRSRGGCARCRAVRTSSCSPRRRRPVLVRTGCWCCRTWSESGPRSSTPMPVAHRRAHPVPLSRRPLPSHAREDRAAGSAQHRRTPIHRRNDRPADRGGRRHQGRTVNPDRLRPDWPGAGHPIEDHRRELWRRLSRGGPWRRGIDRRVEPPAGSCEPNPATTAATATRTPATSTSTPPPRRSATRWRDAREFTPMTKGYDRDPQGRRSAPVRR